MKQKYELSYIISAGLNEEAAQEISKEINNFIQSQGGIVSESQFPRKIALGYPIRKEVFAWFQTTYFNMDSSQSKELEKRLREEKSVLRFLILKTKPARIRAARRTKPPGLSEKIKTKEESSQKVELGEIEKKLEEILKED